MHAAIPFDTRRLSPALRGRADAWAAAAGSARALADDATRSLDERLAGLARLETGTPEPALRKLLQACRKDLTTPRFRSWSELYAYGGFAAGPLAGFLQPIDREPEAARRGLEAYCIAVLILRRLAACRDDYLVHDRVYLSADWLAQAGAAPEDLGRAAASPALRAVFDRVLDRLAPMPAAAAMALPEIEDRGLRRALAAGLATHRRLAAKLRRRDPLAGPVRLGRFGRALAALEGRLR